jgi:UMF1 family MFS transporter
MTTSISDAASAVASVPVTSRGRFAWVLFEVGRNPSYVLISTFIYAPYFATYIVGDPVRGQALWADIQIYAGLLVALSAPFLAAIAEAGGPRKPWIACFSALLVVTCTLLWFGLPGGAGLSLFAIGVVIALNNFAYDSTIVFHGAMLSSLGPSGRIGRLSGLGYGLGNVATFTLLVFFLATIALPPQPLFGLDRAAHEDARSVGPIAALWFLIFALPFFLWTPDRRRNPLPMRAVVRRGLASLARTVRSLGHYSNVGKFLLARTIYNDGLNTMLGFGGLYAAGVFGWGITETGLYGILIIPFAAAGGVFGGRLADRIGAKRTLQFSLSGTVLAGLLSLGFTPERLFFVLPYRRGEAVAPFPYFETAPELCYIAVVCFMAFCIVASYANSRTMMARLAPESRMTEFFGLYTMSGEATAWAAPAAVAIATRVSDSQQWGMAAILVFLAGGLALLTLVREERATAV